MTIKTITIGSNTSCFSCPRPPSKPRTPAACCMMCMMCKLPFAFPRYHITIIIVAGQKGTRTYNTYTTHTPSVRLLPLPFVEHKNHDQTEGTPRQPVSPALCPTMTLLPPLQVLYQVLIYDSRICGTRYVAQVRVFLVRFIIWGYRGTHPSMGVPGYLPEYGITGYLPEYGVPGHLPEYGLPGYLPVYWGIRVHTSMGVPGYIPKYGGTRVHTRVVGTRVATRVMDTRVSTPV